MRIFACIALIVLSLMTFSCARTATCVPNYSQPVIADTAPSHKKQPCRVQKQIDLEANAKASNGRMTWVRCGPAEVGYTPSGDEDYPEDTVTVSTDAGNQIIYSNGEFSEQEGVSRLERVHLKSDRNQALFVWHDYGTGNIHGWKILDFCKGKLREWSVPDLLPAYSKMLEKGERIGKQEGNGPRVDGDSLIEGNLVYHTDDPNCCPTGGFIRARLNGEDGVLHIVKVWREAPE